eukprot:g9192.t1
MLQLVAWTCGRREVELCDCALLAHVLWSTLDLMQPFQHWLRGRLARGAPRPAASPARALRGLLGGLVERVESERIELDELGKELKVFEEVVQKEILEKERQQALLREHCWLAPAQQEELIEAIEEELEQGSRALLLEVYRLEEVRESMPGELANYARERRSQGELPATDPMPGERRRNEGCGRNGGGGIWRTEPQTFKLGKHKGRSFSDVAENDVDYCRMVERKLAEGSFSGDAPLDRQVRAFVAYLKSR